MKRFLAGLLVCAMTAMMSMPAMAAEVNETDVTREGVTGVTGAAATVSIADVDSKYWASKEIRTVVDGKIMSLNNEGKFLPEAKMTRIEFVNALLTLLTNCNCNVKIKNSFVDVNESTPYFQNILRSEQLGLVYGYPDKTFRPNNVMTRSETQSVISHITLDKTADTSVLKQFKDYEDVPAWAIAPYAKSINHGIYVNHPDAKALRPNDILIRAEAAVLLANLKDKIGLIKEEYYGEDLERVLAVEHLNVTKKAPCNEVKITNKRKAIIAGNVLEVAFDEKFKSKEHKAGDTVYFVNEDAIYTVEGTELVPANSKFSATILDIKDPRWFNKNARVYIQLNKITFPDGKEVALNAKPFYKDYALKEGWWVNAGKVALTTVAGVGAGIGAGVGFAFIPHPAKIGRGIAIGAPVGAAVGLITGLVTPGLNYVAKCGEEIYVILLEDASILK